MLNKTFPGEGTWEFTHGKVTIAIKHEDGASYRDMKETSRFFKHVLGNFVDLDVAKLHIQHLQSEVGYSKFKETCDDLDARLPINKISEAGIDLRNAAFLFNGCLNEEKTKLTQSRLTLFQCYKTLCVNAS